MSDKTSSGHVIRLSIMMFLQFFVWGAWFVTLGQCLGENGLADFIGKAYGTAPLAAILAPLFLGLIADRFFSSERVMGVLMLIGGVLMCLVPKVAATGNGQLVVWLFLAHMLCFMPTLGLGNTITFSNIGNQLKFPVIRVWGTIGWIAAGLLVGFKGWSAQFNIFWLAGGSAILLGLYCFSLPNTPPPAKGKPLSWRTLLMVDSFSLMAKPAFLVFIVCSTLICIPLAYYFAFTSNFLSNTGFLAPASTMSIGQMSEIVFMLLIPFFLRRLGIKYMILVGMLAWVIRYALFAFGAPDQVMWMLFLGIAMHGICYDFFFVTGFMYTDRAASDDTKGQAQSMLVFFTQGVGMYFGYMVAGGKFGSVKAPYEALQGAINEGRVDQALSFLQSLGQLFSVEKLSVAADLIGPAMTQWKSFWMFPSAMAAVIAVIFFVLFRDQAAKKAALPESEPEQNS